jgi:hypothetical protein
VSFFFFFFFSNPNFSPNPNHIDQLTPLDRDGLINDLLDVRTPWRCRLG